MSTPDRTTRTDGATTAGTTTGASQVDQRSARRQLVDTQKERFGGVKVGSAFFGWLTATGMTVVLLALLAAAGTAVALTTGTSAQQVTSQATGAAAGTNPDGGTIGLVGGIVLLVVLLVAYYCGGYVAGRMARFNGVRQGVAVWVWAVVIAVVVAVLSYVAGSRYDVLSSVNTFPRLPVGQGQLTTGAVVAVVIALVVSLVGAVLGGLAGMNFHRRVDKATLGD